MKKHARKKKAAAIVVALGLISAMAVGYATVNISNITISGSLTHTSAGYGSPIVDINWTGASEQAVYTRPDLEDLEGDGSVVAKAHTITVTEATTSNTTANVSISGFSTEGDYAIIKLTAATGAGNNMEVVIDNVNVVNPSTFVTVTCYSDAACTVPYFNTNHTLGAGASTDIYVKFLCENRATGNGSNDFTLTISSSSGEWL